jgi:hypothetical protein
MRLGGIPGAWVGFFLSALRAAPCCASPPGPLLPPARVLIDGLVDALVIGLSVCALAVLLTRRPAGPIFYVGVWIAILLALIVAPISYYLIVNPFLALFVGGVLGALIGWLVCRFLCRRKLTVGLR